MGRHRCGSWRSSDCSPAGRNKAQAQLRGGLLIAQVAQPRQSLSAAIGGAPVPTRLNQPQQGHAVVAQQRPMAPGQSRGAIGVAADQTGRDAPGPQGLSPAVPSRNGPPRVERQGLKPAWRLRRERLERAIAIGEIARPVRQEPPLTELSELGSRRANPPSRGHQTHPGIGAEFGGVRQRMGLQSADREPSGFYDRSSTVQPAAP